MSLDRLQALCARGRALAGAPRATGPWYRFTNEGERAEAFIYGPIGDDWEGVAAASFVKELRAVKAPTLDLHINSPGGFVFDAVAIYSALKNHPATVTTYVDGIAASAASFVAQAGDEIVVEKPARMMIHNAGGLVIGNASDMREMADLLDELSDTIAGIYVDRAGGTVASWREAMGAETWYSAAQAVEAGLADRVANDKTTAPAENRRSQMIRARARATLGRVK